jgi:hypothetical protein
MSFLHIQYFLFAVWLLSLGITLVWIQRGKLDPLTKAVWALIALLIPILGSLAFIVVHRLGSRQP